MSTSVAEKTNRIINLNAGFMGEPQETLYQIKRIVDETDCGRRSSDVIDCGSYSEMILEVGRIMKQFGNVEYFLDGDGMSESMIETHERVWRAGYEDPDHDQKVLMKVNDEVVFGFYNPEYYNSIGDDAELTQPGWIDENDNEYACNEVEWMDIPR